MEHRCEVCSALETLGLSASDHGGAGRSRRLLLEDRLLTLCDGHYDELQAAGARTLEEARLLFGEPGGRRSLLTRRGPQDRRLFPPRPEVRRHRVDRRQKERAVS